MKDLKIEEITIIQEKNKEILKEEKEIVKHLSDKIIQHNNKFSKSIQYYLRKCIDENMLIISFLENLNNIEPFCNFYYYRALLNNYTINLSEIPLNSENTIQLIDYLKSFNIISIPVNLMGYQSHNTKNSFIDAYNAIESIIYSPNSLLWRQFIIFYNIFCYTC